MALQFCSTNPSPGLFICSGRTASRSKPGGIPPKHQGLCTRRSAAALATAFLAFSGSNAAYPFELRLTVPDQTPEEAYEGIQAHAQELLEIKALVDSQSWREAQLALRKSSSYLKLDLYTIIQVKPGSQRPQLRKLYSNLFNNVSRLDYAARDRDATRVQECYDNIVAAIDEILARIR